MSHKALYTEQDNAEFNKKFSEEFNKDKSETSTVIEKSPFGPDIGMIEENGATVVKVDNPQLFNNIKDIFTNSIQPQNKNYFTRGGGLANFNIDKTIFTPSPVVCLSGKKFEEKYLKQLEEFIFTTKENIDTDKLIGIIYLMSFITQNVYPITITTSKHKQLLPKIVFSLNKFFNDNYSTIFSIFTMVTNSRGVQQEHQNGTN